LIVKLIKSTYNIYLEFILQNYSLAMVQYFGPYTRR